MADKPVEQNIFTACVTAAIDEDDGKYPDYRLVVRVILQKALDLTPSPRTAAELTRILAQEVKPEPAPRRPYNPSTVYL